MARYCRRRFAVGADESLACEMRIELEMGVVLVVLRDVPGETPPGVLSARFEYLANLVALELVLRGDGHRTVRFFHERVAFDNGRVFRAEQLQEVQLLRRDGRYCYARWVPVDVPTGARLTAAAASERLPSAGATPGSPSGSARR